LTHASVGDGAREVRHNERLEFLGDRVLNLCAAERLMALDPDSREGEMSRRLANLVNFHACARAAHRVGLPDALRLSASATKVGARKSDAVLGDACEALMAALYIDGGLDTAKAFFARFWAEEFEDLDAPRSKDPKTQLQEWAQGLGLPLPRYQIVSREGPAHAPVFVIEVEVEGFAAERGEGGSRQAAEKSAAQTMLLKREGAESAPETDQ
jgi:ribonuclease-3